MQGKGQVGQGRKHVREMTCEAAEKGERLVAAEDGNSWPRKEGVSQRITYRGSHGTLEFRQRNMGTGSCHWKEEQTEERRHPRCSGSNCPT